MPFGKHKGETLDQIARTERVAFTVLGEPKAKLRPRAVAVQGRPRLVTPKGTRRWEAVVRDMAAMFFPKPIAAGVSVRVVIDCWFALPAASHRKRSPVPAAPLPQREDVDNLCKLVCDAMNGVAWHDDRQVVDARVRKWRCAQNDNRPRTEVIVEWEGDDQPKGEAS